MGTFQLFCIVVLKKSFRQFTTPLLTGCDSQCLGRLFTIKPNYTYTKISLRLLSTWLSLTNAIKPRGLYEKQVSVIYSRAILVAVTSGCSVRRVICKIWTDTLTNSTDPERKVCLNYRNKKIRVKWNSLKSTFRTIFPACTQQQSSHHCCQCLDSSKLHSRFLYYLWVKRPIEWLLWQLKLHWQSSWWSWIAS